MATEQTCEDWTRVCVTFVRAIGLTVTEVDGCPGGFLPHVRVLDGGLVVDVERAFAGDVLHEAGHLAVMPALFRPVASGTLKKAAEAMAAYHLQNPNGLCHPEDPVARGAMQAGEFEATAWQYAAAVHLGLPDHLLFPEGSFANDGFEVLRSLKGSHHGGIHGLQAAGWTCVRACAFRKLPVYPKLVRWLHP